MIYRSSQKTFTLLNHKTSNVTNIDNKDFNFNSIEEALTDIKAGKLVVVVDDENRENEGDLIGAAESITPDLINFMAVEARGLICLALTGDRLDQLDLPLMVSKNTDTNQTAFTISIDAGRHLGVTTGISAEDRAKTIQVAIDPQTKPEDLNRPGHIFPIRARKGGVLKRAGHTEAGVDLAKLAGLDPSAVICEIQNSDGSMARLPELIKYAQKFNLKIITIADLISYCLKNNRFVYRETIANLPSQFGNFQIYGYKNSLDNTEHVAIVKGDPATFGDEPVMVRMHSECLTGDALGSLRCDCQMQLQAALKMIENAGRGVVVYLRQEGRGIGLVNKLKAYSLQDLGFDTVEANERLGFPADLRDYGMGAQMLNDLGVKKICLITNNPRKIAGLKGYGLEIVDRVPLLIEANDYNTTYLTTKAQKLGHLLLQTYLITIAIDFSENVDSVTRYEKIEQIRSLAKANDLLLQEEARPVSIAVFGQPLLVFHLGFDQPKLAFSQWYQNQNHPYSQAITQILDQLITFPKIKKIKFLIGEGDDPMSSLQVNLIRKNLDQKAQFAQIFHQLETQVIYQLIIDNN